LRTPTVHRRLKSLHRKIKNRLGPERSFLYSPEVELSGCEGEGPLVIIGYRPSTDLWKENAPSRRLLYDTIKAHQLGGAYLTDCIKERSRVEDDGKDYDLDWNLSVLKEELEIVGPQALIVLGSAARRFLVDHGFARRYRIAQAYHFGIVHNWQRHWPSVKQAEQAFRNSFSDAVQACSILTAIGQHDESTKSSAQVPNLEEMKLWMKQLEHVREAMQRTVSHSPEYFRLKEEADSLIHTISSEMKRRGVVLKIATGGSFPT